MLGTKYIEEFLYYALQTHYEALEPLLQRMLASSIPEVQTVGARQVCIASLAIDKAVQLAQGCITGTDAKRIGAAEIFSFNVKDSKYKNPCKEALITLFN